MKESEYTALFAKKIRARGWQFTESSKQENMFHHIDGYVTVYNGTKAISTFSVELKGDKYRSRRLNGRKDCLCQYIEFINVNGDIGWLFGRSHYIVVLSEDQDKFYMIPRTDMIKFSEKLFGINFSNKTSVDLIKQELDSLPKDMWVNSSENSHHKLFTRESRNDVVTQISMDEVASLSQIILS